MDRNFPFHSDGAPLVILPACNRMLGEHPFHIVGKKYIDAVRLAGCTPIVIPGASEAEIPRLLAMADGILLTGSPSNVHPSHFGQDVLKPELPLDPDRDAWTLPLIRAALAHGTPLMGICRGTQETNVALGGSLHQAVHEVDGHRDHRSDDAQSAAVQYGPAHEVYVEAGGLLERIVGQPRFMVNSIHGQAVSTLAPGLRVEARAPDGVIEAFSVPQAPGFALCLQWHPEWQAKDNPVSMKMLKAFGDACRTYRDRHRKPQPQPA